jgi:hypothetical protein
MPCPHALFRYPPNLHVVVVPACSGSTRMSPAPGARCRRPRPTGPALRARPQAGRRPCRHGLLLRLLRSLWPRRGRPRWPAAAAGGRGAGPASGAGACGARKAPPHPPRSPRRGAVGTPARRQWARALVWVRAAGQEAASILQRCSSQGRTSHTPGHSLSSRCMLLHTPAPIHPPPLARCPRHAQTRPPCSHQGHVVPQPRRHKVQRARPALTRVTWCPSPGGTKCSAHALLSPGSRGAPAPEAQSAARAPPPAGRRARAPAAPSPPAGRQPQGAGTACGAGQYHGSQPPGAGTAGRRIEGGTAVQRGPAPALPHALGSAHSTLPTGRSAHGPLHLTSPPVQGAGCPRGQEEGGRASHLVHVCRRCAPPPPGQVAQHVDRERGTRHVAAAPAGSDAQLWGRAWLAGGRRGASEGLQSHQAPPARARRRKRLAACGRAESGWRRWRWRAGLARRGGGGHPAPAR